MSSPANKVVVPMGLRVRDGFTQFFSTQVAGAVVLLAAAIVALVIANTPFNDAVQALWNTQAGFVLGRFEFHQSLLHWVDDGLMALFFLVVGLEVKREMLVGELSAPRKAMLPILAALGGMVAPAAIYFALNATGPGARGWGIPMATDIAFALGVLALLGSRVPSGLKVFLAALAIADDIGAILVIAIFYASDFAGVWLLAAGVLFIVLIALNRLGVDSPWPYFLVGGLLWFAVLLSGVHATIAGVLIAMTIPTTAKLDPLAFTRRARGRLDDIDAIHVDGVHVLVDDRQQLVARDIRQAARRTAAPLQRLEFALQPFTTFVVLPLFALGNAGVRLTGGAAAGLLASPVALGVVLGLVVGKPLGIVAMSWIAVRFGLAELPEGVSWGHVGGAGILGGIGFTMSIFVANLAFTDPALVGAAKAAILTASILAGALGFSVLRRYCSATRCEESQR